MYLAIIGVRLDRTTLKVLVGLLLASVHASARPWTNTEGVTIEADFISSNAQVVVLGLPDGRRASYPVEKLCQTDQDFAKTEALRLSTAAKVAEPPKTNRAKERTLPKKLKVITTPELAKIPHPVDNSVPQLNEYIRLLLAYGDDQKWDKVGEAERAAMLLSLGESNLDLLIEQAFPENDMRHRYPSPWSSTQAISQLATEDSKEMVFKAYAKHYFLAPVIERKKWGHEVEASTLQHLKKMPRWNSYSMFEIEFAALCLSAESPDIWTEFQRFFLRGDFLVGILRSLEDQVPFEKLLAIYKLKWDAVRKNPSEGDIAVANVMVKEGDLDALRLIGRLLVQPISGNYARYLERELPRSSSLVLSLTDAPAGTNTEIGQWVLENAPSLTWEAAKARFVKRIP